MNEESYRDHNSTGIPTRTSFNRRKFLKFLGSGIIIVFSVGDPVALMQERQRRGFGRGDPADFNAYLRIGEDGRVTCYTGKIEMGQGIFTSLAQMLAEELDVPLDSVDMIMGDTALCPWDMGTFGSMSTRYFGPPLRAAAAEARAVLMQLASEHLGLPEERLETKDGFVRDKNDPSNKVSYSSLTEGKRIERRLDNKPPVKPGSTFTLSGKSAGRADAPVKVTGEAKFAGDIQVDGMVHARILRPPTHGAKIKSVDTSDAERITGVQIVRDGDLIAALHPYFDEADRALSRIKAQFELPEPAVDSQSIFQHLLKVAPEGEIVDQKGNLEAGKKLAAVTFEETYTQGYVAHAPIEPHTAVAKVEGGKVTVWASTQRPFGARQEVANALGLSSENVRIITPFVGGGFGGKSRNGQVVEAARLAKLSRRPVQVAWSRKEEFFYDSFQPAAVVKINSGLSESNQIVFWDYQVYFAGGRSSKPFYQIPHYMVLEYGGWMRPVPGAHPFGTGAWRGPGSNTNTFARESQIDIMAAKAGIDPLEFRLQNLQDERMKRVLKTAADRFGWAPSGSPSGRGFGIACVDYSGTYVATAAEVEVDKNTGKIRVKRVVSAQDMGQVINPEGAQAQMEGCITMGLGYALAEEIQFKGGDIHTRNFDVYNIARFSWTPEIETILIDNQDMAPQGGGEPAIACMGGVIANALYDAAGVRLYQLPLTPERIKEAMEA